MDPIQVQKLRAMARYKNQSHFLHKLGKCPLSTAMMGLFLSSPLWIPLITLFIKSLLFVSLPNILKYLFCPKILFVISNVIVFILVGESKFLTNPKCKPIDIYDEYVMKNKGYEKLSVCEENVHRYNDEAVIEKSVVKEGAKEDQEMGDKELKEDEDDEKEQQTRDLVDDFEDADEFGLPVDEFNKRVEDFIARVNQQRMLEAELLICKV